MIGIQLELNIYNLKIINHIMKLIPKIKFAFIVLPSFLFSSTLFAQNVDPVVDPHIDSHVRAFLKVLNSTPGKPIEQLSPVEARAVLTKVQKSVPVDLSGVTTSEKTINQDGIMVKLTIVKSISFKAGGPVFMFFHGGGWVLGDFFTHQRMVRDLVVNSGVSAVFVNYTPSPEAHYPVAINEAYAATKWVANHGTEIGLNGKKLAVVGNSVGGNMATVVCLMAKEKKSPEITYQVLLWPVTDANFETQSYNQYGEGRFLTKKMMIWFWDNYTMDPAQRKEIYASPLQASVEQLQNLPKAMVITDGNDVLRDEGLEYARKLDAAGVSVVNVEYNGMIHDWGLLNPLSEVPATKASLFQVGQELKKALQ